MVKLPPKKPRKREESILLANIRLAIGTRPDFLIARINTGVYAAPATGHRVRSAPNGFPDIIGTQLRRVLEHKRIETNFSLYETDEWLYYGQAIAIEGKAKDGVLSEAQKNWRDMFQSVGGIYIVPRHVDDVLEALGSVPEWLE